MMATALAMTIAGVANAQGAGYGGGAPTSGDMNSSGMNSSGAMSSQASPPATAAGMATDTSASLGSPSNPIPRNSPTPFDQAYTLKAGDPSVISNGPVPDTPQNRRAYGQPMSRAGKLTTPAGN
jgi:hypothetical protein